MIGKCAVPCVERKGLLIEPSVITAPAVGSDKALIIPIVFVCSCEITAKKVNLLKCSYTMEAKSSVPWVLTHERKLSLLLHMGLRGLARYMILKSLVL